MFEVEDYIEVLKRHKITQSQYLLMYLLYKNKIKEILGLYESVGKYGIAETLVKDLEKRGYIYIYFDTEPIDRLKLSPEGQLFFMDIFSTPSRLYALLVQSGIRMYKSKNWRGKKQGVLKERELRLLLIDNELVHIGSIYKIERYLAQSHANEFDNVYDLFSAKPWDLL